MLSFKQIATLVLPRVVIVNEEGVMLVIESEKKSGLKWK
jgi:hypothetical protein